MRTEGSLESRINNLCSIAGYTEDEMQKLGTKLMYAGTTGSMLMISSKISAVIHLKAMNTGE